MKVLKAVEDPSGRRAVPFQGQHGELVLPYCAEAGAPYAFRGISSRKVCGAVAAVDDEPSVTAHGIALLECAAAGVEDPRVPELLAAVVEDYFGWLADVPVGARVGINRRGLMRLRPLDGPDWHREDARAWARRERERGRLPFLAEVDGRCKVASIAWGGRLAAVDVDEVLAEVRDHKGFRRTRWVEVL